MESQVIHIARKLVVMRLHSWHRGVYVVFRLLAIAIAVGSVGSTASAAEGKTESVFVDACVGCTPKLVFSAPNGMRQHSRSPLLASIERAARELGQSERLPASRVAQGPSHRRSVKSAALIGAAIGGGAGAVSGAMFGAQSGEEGAPAYGAALFGGIGALAGAATGAIIAALSD
jgi:hypothetical protein